MSDVLESVLDSLTHLLVGDDGRSRMTWPKARANAFDGFEILGEGLGTNHDQDVLLGSASDVPIWPMDARWAVRTQHGGEDGWLFQRCSTLDRSKWRGKLAVVSTRMFEVAEQFVAPSGLAVGGIAPFAVFGDRVASAYLRRNSAPANTNLGSVYGTTEGDRIEPSDLFTLALAQGIELRREYCWSVLLGEAGIPRARFVTDATGIREAFRLRDLPAGAARRKALRHWVQAHWRQQRPSSEADRHAVRAYLRGATDFAWSGLLCTIEPSRHDLRQAHARSVLKKSSSRSLAAV